MPAGERLCGNGEETQKQLLMNCELNSSSQGKGVS